MATQHHFEVRGKCKSCKGTGLYVGLTEQCGAAVVCHTCKGTGEVTFSVDWDDFHDKELRPSVVRVYRTNPGIGIGTGNGHRLEDFGGMPYESWIAGKDFPSGSEMRTFTCPAWYYQSADYSKKPEWKECIRCGTFSGCKYFSRKDQCWTRWDIEQTKEADANGH